MMMRRALAATTRLPTSLRFCFATPFFARPREDGKELPKDVPEPRELPREGREGKEGRERKEAEREAGREALAALVARINDANKYFLGVKLNTNYLKVTKTLTYEEASQLTTDRTTANDIPLDFSKKELDSEPFEKADQAGALKQRSAQVVFSRSRLQPTVAAMQRIIQEFVVSVGKNSRMSNVEPNFHLQCIKALNSLDQRLQLRLTNEDALPEVKITAVTLLKGLSAYRNDNYSTDSFEKDESELPDGIVAYKLYRQLKEEYPEPEWFSTRRINARFELLVRGGPLLSLLDSGSDAGTTNTLHSVVIETDLVPPPPNAQHLLTPEQFLRSYRLDYNALLLTNFDRKNAFYPLTYSEHDKKTALLNRII